MTDAAVPTDATGTGREFIVSISTFKAMATRGLASAGTSDSPATLFLNGRTVADEPRPMKVFATFSDNPPPLLGNHDSSSITLFLRLADLPAWLAALSDLPADLTVFPGEGDRVDSVVIHPGDSHGEFRELSRRLRT